MMMDSIREGVKKPWAKIVIFAIVISFVGAGYFTSAFFSGDPFAAAVVNGESVSTNEFQRAYSRTRQQYGEMFKQIVKTEEQERNFRENVLQSLISQTVTIQAAKDLGIRVSVPQIRKTIREIPAAQADGVFSTELLDRVLLSNNMSREQLKQDVVANLILSQLVSGLSASEFVTERELEQTFSLQGQKRSGRALPIKYSLFDAGVEVSDEEINTYYEANKDRFRIEEKVAVDYIELSVATLKDQIEVTEEQVTEYYAENIDRYRSDEQKRVSHILVASEDESEEALAKVNQLRERLLAGEAFEQVVQESSDEFSAANGGDLGFLAKGDMEEAFENAVAKLNSIGDLSEPVKTSFGYHIIKLTELVEGETQPLADVREQIVETLKGLGAEEAFYAKSNILEEKTFEITDSLAEVSKEIGVEVKTSPKFGRNSGTGLFANSEVREAAFDENVVVGNANSSVISLGETHVVVLRLNSHQPSEIKPLEQVKEQVVAELKSTKAQVAATAFGDSLKDKLARNEPIEELIQLKGLAWRDLDKVNRTSAALPYQQLQHFFSMPKPDSGGPTIDTLAAANEYVLLVLNSVEPGDLTQAEETAVTQTKQRLNRFLAEANYSSFVEQKRSEADVSRNLDNINR